MLEVLRLYVVKTKKIKTNINLFNPKTNINLFEPYKIIFTSKKKEKR